MGPSEILMEAFAYDPVIMNQYRTDDRIRRHPAAGQYSELDAALHPALVCSEC